MARPDGKREWRAHEDRIERRIEVAAIDERGPRASPDFADIARGYGVHADKVLGGGPTAGTFSSWHAS